MDFKEIQDLIKLINKSNLTEFKMEQGDLKLSIRTKDYVNAKRVGEIITPSVFPPAIPTFAANPIQHQPQQAAPAAAAPPKEEAAPKETASNLIEVISPMVGTFYRSSAPDKPVFVKVGDNISDGSVVCIVEAMKLFNEIESEVSGKIVKVLVEDAQPVEYGTPLFLVDPKG